ncbi:hypothetical protein GDO81_003209 [Engystomops pustulosus]|uniref:Uncharacterized protein n=1 Tax=Engystomops pustulosus TaxID=76066 RepID=A0AAV6ZWX9_ENGPU|nr:hypothetical protein GDO81_003209 [Engystomops pustulosus]
MHRILGADPLLKLQSEGQRVQESYCYQIFIEKQQGMNVPNVQQLLEQSFHHSRLKLAEVPSCFIIQMPRFGKEYKMFSKIVPSLELDVTDLLSDSPRECVVCGTLATHECAECFLGVLLSDSGLKQYCRPCNERVTYNPFNYPVMSQPGITHHSGLLSPQGPFTSQEEGPPPRPPEGPRGLPRDVR